MRYFSTLCLFAICIIAIEAHMRRPGSFHPVPPFPLPEKNAPYQLHGLNIIPSREAAIKSIFDKIRLGKAAVDVKKQNAEVPVPPQLPVGVVDKVSKVGGMPPPVHIKTEESLNKIRLGMAALPYNPRDKPRN